MLALCRLLIDLGAAIVPAAYRDDWKREWHAELYYRAEALGAAGGLSPGAGCDLLARSAGALVHAAWLRKEEWSVSVLTQDFRYAVRGLRVRAAFAAICILILALGIAANASMFTVVNGVLLEPLPFRAPGRLVQIWETNPLMNWTHEVVAPANMLDWRDRNQTLTDIAYYIGSDTRAPGIDDATLIGFGEPERVRSVNVSGNFFEVLGVEAQIGRTLRPSDVVPGAPPVIVLSDGFWRRRFGGSPSIVGTRVEINGIPREIVGVGPPRFALPGTHVDFWQPHQISESDLRRIRRAHWFRAVGRLKEGVTIDQAAADLARIAADLERQYPDTNTKMGVGVGPLHEWFVGEVRRPILMMMAAVGAVLMITCMNVASLLLTRASGRRREIAIRVALGAGRMRLLRQLLVESLVLSIAAGLVSLPIAQAAIRLLQRYGPAGIPRLEQIRLDATVLLFVMGVVIATAVLFGTAPAWQTARAPAADSLKDGSRGTRGEGTRLRRALIAAEVALSVALLIGAGLLLRSFDRLRAVDPGIDATEALTFRVKLPSRYNSSEKVTAYFATALERIRALPGVRAAGATARLALEGRTWTGDLYITGRPDVWGRDLRHKTITTGYLAAVRLPVLRGRDFSTTDAASSQRVVLVNRTLASRFFGSLDPVGQQIAFDRPSPTTSWLTIVGVVADEKQDALDAQVQPEVYTPHPQEPRNAMTIVVRSSTAADTLLGPVRQAMAAVDNAVAIYDVRTLEQVVERSVSEERFSAMLTGAFAGTALILAAVGLYGLVAFSVAERTREIGVRIALGASRPAVLRMIMSDAARVLVPGAILGVLAAIATGRTIRAFLFETPATDPLVYASVAVVLLAVGLMASYLPARRAARVDPAISLRVD